MMERLETPRGIQCAAQKAANLRWSSESLQVAFVHTVTVRVEFVLECQRGGMLCRDRGAGDLQLLRAGDLGHRYLLCFHLANTRHGKCRSRVNPPHSTH